MKTKQCKKKYSELGISTLFRSGLMDDNDAKQGHCCIGLTIKETNEILTIVSLIYKVAEHFSAQSVPIRASQNT